jgi:flagellar basal-body rod modification protein FlgD
MTVSPASSTGGNPAATAPAATKSAMVGLGENFDSFLKMLTTQLKHQDPMSPLDTNQFTQQLVSFSQVEQAIKANDRLESLVSLFSSTTLASSMNLIGKTVGVESAEMHLPEGGEIAFEYELPAASKETALTVTDISGAIVWKGAGATSVGSHAFAWDGTDSSGKPVPAGTYKLEVGGERLDGTPMSAVVRSSGLVEAIAMKDGAGALAFGNLEVPTSKLVTIHN